MKKGDIVVLVDSSFQAWIDIGPLVVLEIGTTEPLTGVEGFGGSEFCWIYPINPDCSHLSVGFGKSGGFFKDSLRVISSA